MSRVLLINYYKEILVKIGSARWMKQAVRNFTRAVKGGGWGGATNEHTKIPIKTTSTDPPRLHLCIHLIHFLCFFLLLSRVSSGGKTQYSIASVYSVQTWMPSFAVNYLNCGFLLLITAAYTVHRVCHNYPGKEEFELWQSYVNPVSWKRVIPTFSFTRATGPFTRRNVTRAVLAQESRGKHELKDRLCAKCSVKHQFGSEGVCDHPLKRQCKNK